MRFQNELEGAGIPTGVVESGGEAVQAVREGGYHAVIVPAVLSDMSSYDFCMSLVRHMQGVFVVLYGALDDRYADALRQSGVAHVTGAGNESMPHVLARRFGVPLAGSPSTPVSGSHSPFGVGMPAAAMGADGAQTDRVAQLEEDLGLAESELEDTRNRLANVEEDARRSREELKSAERRLSEAVDELAKVKGEVEAARKSAERANKERDGLKALVGSLEEDRVEMEKRVLAAGELEREKVVLEEMLADLTRKLAAKTAEPDNERREQEESLTDVLANLAPLTWGMVQAADWLQEHDAPSDHVRALRIAVRSVETLLDEARARGLLKT